MFGDIVGNGEGGIVVLNLAAVIVVKCGYGRTKLDNDSAPHPMLIDPASDKSNANLPFLHTRPLCGLLQIVVKRRQRQAASQCKLKVRGIVGR